MNVFESGKVLHVSSMRCFKLISQGPVSPASESSEEICLVSTSGMSTNGDGEEHTCPAAARAKW